MALIRHGDVPELADPRDSVLMRALVRAAEHGADVSVTWVHLSGRHRRLRTERSTRVYYVLDGSAIFVIGDNPPMRAFRDDTIVIGRGEPYEFWGEMTYLVINSPAFVDGDDIYDTS